eukprot:XP_001694499.1 mitochondrial carrier protein [Chlamydomonas reinhardtii]
MSRSLPSAGTLGQSTFAPTGPLAWLASVPSFLAASAAGELQHHHHQPWFEISPSSRHSTAQAHAASTSASQAQLTGHRRQVTKGTSSGRSRGNGKQQQQESYAGPASAFASATCTAACSSSATAVAASNFAAPGWLQAATVAAGAASRTLAQVAIHPLDTVKTRMQVSIPASQLQVWRAVMSCAATRRAALVAWAGPAGARDLFLGLSGAVGGTLPSAALFFATEAAARPALAGLLGCEADAAPARLLASAAAAAASALIRVPADVLKHRVQAYVYPSVTAAARDIVSRRGLAGLYAGFGATLLRDAPELVIQFTAYTQLKALLHKAANANKNNSANQNTKNISSSTSSSSGQQQQQQQVGGSAATAAAMVEHLAVGGAAGAAAALATTPLDVIKTQLQCGGASTVGGAVANVLRASGGSPAALFAGLGPRLLQTTLCSALFFTCYEASKVRLGELAAAQRAQQAQALQAAQQEAERAVVVAAVAQQQQGGGGRFWRRRRHTGSSSGSGSDLWEARAELHDA